MAKLQRAHILGTLVLLLAGSLLVVLLGRVVWIQKHVTEEEAVRLTRQHEAAQPLLADRGIIRMSDGTPAALSVRVYNMYADPSFIVDPEGKLDEARKEIVALTEKIEKLTGSEKDKATKRRDELDAKLLVSSAEVEQAKKLLAEAIGPLLNKTPDEMMGLIINQASYPNGHPRRFLWLAKEVDESFYLRFNDLKAKYREEAKQAIKDVRDVKDKQKRADAIAKARVYTHALDGVGFDKSIRREYPLEQLAGPVIGFTNIDGGVDAMEHQLDPLLKGLPGRAMLIKDAGRRTLMIEEKGYRPAGHGYNVWLTLDTVMQGIAEEELRNACIQYKAESGVAVLMDPKTGRVVALANWPTYDPNKYQEASPAARRNKAFDPYEPGSIFKPFVMAWAIEKGVVRPSDIINCHFGHWSDPTGRAVTDVHGYGAMTCEDIIIKSSNIGMAQVGWKMGIPTLNEGVRTFGFGDRTGIEAPGDEKGIVTPTARWNKGTLTSVSFGYEVAATPIQLVRAYATFANGGYLVTPRLIHAVELEPGNTKSWSELAGPPIEKQIISASTCEAMKKMMEGVYITGTAKKAASKVYRLFGKTGTAHLAVHGAGHYADNQYNASFLAGGPMTNPQLVAVVTLHKPDKSLGHFGGTVAAPACSQMLERALLYKQVPGDQVEQTRRVDPLAVGR